MPITYLDSRRKKHLRNHFEIRLTEAFGRAWWLVFDAGNHKPEFVGGDEKLPKYAREQLARLSADPKVMDRRRARHIDVSLCFFPGSACNGIPHNQNVDWLRQYRRFSVRGTGYSYERAYLVVLDSGNEDYPTQIWESRITKRYPRFDDLDSEYGLVWKRLPEED